MKSLVLAFDDEEFQALKDAKGTATWREFILTLSKKRPGGKP
jgi:hypothetical protein